MIPSVDIVCSKIQLRNSEIIVFVVYIASPTVVEYYTRLTEAFEQFELVYKYPVVIVGDFNVPDFCTYSGDENSPKSELLYNLADFF